MSGRTVLRDGAMEPARQLPAATSGDGELPAELSAPTGASGDIAAHLRDVDQELRLAARRLERPVNHVLLCITRVGKARLEHCPVPDKSAESPAQVEFAYQRDG